MSDVSDQLSNGLKALSDQKPDADCKSQSLPTANLKNQMPHVKHVKNQFLV